MEVEQLRWGSLNCYLCSMVSVAETPEKRMGIGLWRVYKRAQQGISDR